MSSRPLPGAAVAGVDLGTDDYCALSLALSGAVVLTMRLCAAEAGLSEEQLISRLVAQHAEKIGIARLSEFMQGGEAVSRVAHNHDVAGSNPAPATRQSNDLTADGLRSGRDNGRDARSGLRPAAVGPP